MTQPIPFRNKLTTLSFMSFMVIDADCCKIRNRHSKSLKGDKIGKFYRFLPILLYFGILTVRSKLHSNGFENQNIIINFAHISRKK